MQRGGKTIGYRVYAGTISKKTETFNGTSALGFQWDTRECIFDSQGDTIEGSVSNRFLEDPVLNLAKNEFGSFEATIPYQINTAFGSYKNPVYTTLKYEKTWLVVEEDGKRERGSSGGGGRFGYDWFLGDVDGEARADAWAKEAVRMALVNLNAVAAPAGTFPVVLGAGWPGVLLHEAVGHGLEGDFNRRGTSVFSGQMGQLVSSELCTVVDDGTMRDRRGSVAIDDEGTPGQYNVLIENGVLKGYMQDKLNARLMGVAPTGNGRRESYAHLPMPRMTNTYMLPGKSTPQEIIESVDYGIFAPNFGGGQVDITSGKFVFSTSEAYLIEKGKVTKAVKGATLIGSGIEAMQQISMVGNDLKLDNGVGVCGKEGQSLPVGVGQPTLKVDNLTVGGTA